MLDPATPDKGAPACVSTLQAWSEARNGAVRRSRQLDEPRHRHRSRGRPAPREPVLRDRLACVTIHGGIVEKFAGDAVLAAFGVPQAHEDDAERATRAALAMREAVVELGLEARIGIEAGELVVEDAESTFVTGEAVNLAARLQQAARPGEILLGPTAYRLAAGSLVVEDAGPLELKGIDGPLRAWRVVDAARPPGAPGWSPRAARRPRNRARAPREHVRPHGARRARAPVHDLRRAGHRQEPPRARVPGRARARERPHRDAVCPTARASRTGRSPR